MGKLLIWTLKDLAESIETRVNNQFDARIVVEGVTGIGKSTLIYKLCHRLKGGIVPFKPSRDIIYSREDAIKHLTNRQKSIIFNDEMINVTYKRDFFSEGQKTLIRAMNMYRDNFNVFLMAVPSFVDLDRDIRGLCCMRITVVRRGVALIQMPKISLYTSDIWDVRYNQKIESDWSKSKTKNPQYSKLSTTVGILHFGDMTSQQREEYNSIKRSKRAKVFGEYNDSSFSNDPERMFYEGLLETMKDGKLSKDALDIACKVHGREVVSVRKRLNGMLKDKNEDSRVKDYLVTPNLKVKKDFLGFVKDTEKVKLNDLFFDEFEHEEEEKISQ